MRGSRPVRDRAAFLTERACGIWYMGDYRPERVQRKRKKRTFVSMNERHIDINEFDYDLPDGRIAKFPLAERSASKLLVYRGGEIGEAHFADIGDVPFVLSP